MKKVYDAGLMQIMSMFSSVCGVTPKDCMAHEQMLVFVVGEGLIAKAVGKAGANIRRLEAKLKKKIKVVEYSDDLLQFVKNVVAPLEVAELSEDDSVVTLIAKDLKTRGLLIGRNASNLRFFESIVKRFYPIKELKVK
ncbi:NusA-like transcription termination signal-binding factor [Candidatus Woesearchaeota archaeon]|nr:NusA-like transcription termination signal-binding factor [Candidatus Woesearchaeota archaeon]